MWGCPSAQDGLDGAVRETTSEKNVNTLSTPKSLCRLNCNRDVTMIAVLAIMLAGAGFAEEPKLSSDDVAVIKEALIHFASKTNYWNWSSTNEPLLLVELWSRESGKAECNNTNRTDVIIKKVSRCPSSLEYWWGSNRYDCLDGFGEDGKTTRIQPSTLASMISRKETDLSQLADVCPIFKLSQDDKFFSDRVFADKYPTATRWVDVWLPGFNETSTEAFIGFMFGPRHSASVAFYKLQRTAPTEVNWKVTWYQFKYYP